MSYFSEQRLIHFKETERKNLGPVFKEDTANSKAELISLINEYSSMEETDVAKTEYLNIAGAKLVETLIKEAGMKSLGKSKFLPFSIKEFDKSTGSITTEPLQIDATTTLTVSGESYEKKIDSTDPDQAGSYSLTFTKKTTDKKVGTVEVRRYKAQALHDEVPVPKFVILVDHVVVDLHNEEFTDLLVRSIFDDLKKLTELSTKNDVKRDAEQKLKTLRKTLPKIKL